MIEIVFLDVGVAILTKGMDSTTSLPTGTMQFYQPKITISTISEGV